MKEYLVIAVVILGVVLFVWSKSMKPVESEYGDRPEPQGCGDRYLGDC
jgi:hypothetical protein